MRKYFQITFFLVTYGLLVVLKNFKGGDEVQVVQKPVLNNQPTLIPTSTPAPIISSPNVTFIPTQIPTPTAISQGQYKNGSYTGKAADAFYGIIQVQAVIQNGKIQDVLFLQYPNDNQTSVFVNTQAMPLLKQEALQAQSAQVDIISGASASSDAFRVSLADALSQAK